MNTKRERRATDLLNVAIAGAESAVAVANSFAESPVCKNALEKAREYLDEARHHLTVIQLHASKI